VFQSETGSGIDISSFLDDLRFQRNGPADPSTPHLSIELQRTVTNTVVAPETEGDSYNLLERMRLHYKTPALAEQHTKLLLTDGKKLIGKLFQLTESSNVGNIWTSRTYDAFWGHCEATWKQQHSDQQTTAAATQNTRKRRSIPQ